MASSPFLSISPGLVSTADVALIGDKNPDGIFDLETIPGLALQDLYENRMRYAIHSTTGPHIELVILPSSVIAVPIGEDVFISNIYRDPQARWLLRGIDRAQRVEACRGKELTRFTFTFEDARKSFLFVRLSPPHDVSIGMTNGELAVRISRSTKTTTDYGLLSELTIAVGEDSE